MIGEKIKKVLEKNNITQTSVAKKMGVSVACVNQWIADKRDISNKDIKKFCELFNTTPNYLYGFEDEITESDRHLLQAFKAMATASTGDNLNKNIPEQTKER